MDIDAFADLVVGAIKSALAPVQADVRALQAHAAAADARWNDLGALRERVAVVEAKAAQPPDLHEVSERLSSLHLRQEMSTAAEQALIVEMHKLSDVRERVAVLETRAQVPGPAGTDGVDGRAGTDGRDGVGFEDLTVDHDGERGFTLRAVRADQTKELGTFTIPALIYRGVHQAGKTYDNGDVVTWAGSTWVANEQTTTKPGEYAGAAVWTLCVKKGRDGRDGKDAPSLPVVSVGRH